MSNYKSVAVVTAALKNRLTAVCEAALSGASITTLRPDNSSSGLPTKGANLFLYQITPNTAQRNADLPTRRPDGSVTRHPTAAIDLHYLLSFYGDDSAFETQILLGSVVSNLHAQPSLSRVEIQQVFSASALGNAGTGGAATPGDPAIADLKVAGQAALLDPSGLADAVDLVRFTPTDLSLEELSKLWSVFLDTPYVLSLIYQAGPVLIQDTSDLVTAGVLPVRLLGQVQAVASAPPSIARVIRSGGAGQPIVASSTLSLAGLFYPGAVPTVLIDGAAAQQLTLPATLPVGQPPITGVPIPATLSSGAHGIQVVQQVPSGLKNPPPPSPVYSAVAGFVLYPSITSTSVATGSATRDVTVVVAPPVAAHQTVSLLLNLLTPAAANPSGVYELEIQAPQADGQTNFVFPTKGQPGGDLPAGVYLVRIQIDGIASSLTFVPPPTTGAATGPAGSTAGATGSAAAPAGSTASPTGSAAPLAGSAAAPTGSAASSPGSAAGPTEPAAAPAGSAAAPTGSAAAPAGSTAGPTESAVAPAGSAAAPPTGSTAASAGSTATPPGSAAAPPTGSAAAPTGSTAAATESAMAPAGSTAAPAGSGAAPTGSTATLAGSTVPTTGFTAPTIELT